MSHQSRSESSFTCMVCGLCVTGAGFGTRHRNHCPRCLWSRHLDEEPGDRLCPCRRPMEPVAIEVRAGGEWAIIHRCSGCHALKVNRIAGDDHELALLALAIRPLAHPAFPLDAIRVPGAQSP
jgi:hypothetical protein